MDEDVITAEDLEDLLSYHRSFEHETSQVERLAGTINYALAKFLSKIVKQLKEEDDD